MNISSAKHTDCADSFRLQRTSADSSNGWESPRQKREESKGDHENFYCTLSPLLSQKDHDESGKALLLFDYICMLAGVLSKLQTLFIALVLFKVETENTCIVDDKSSRPVPKA